MNYIKKNILTATLSILLTLVFFMPVLSLAGGTSPTGNTGGGTSPTGGGGGTAPTGTIVNPLTNVSSITDLFTTILEGALKIGIPIIALAIIYCGFLFVSARGNPEKIGEARDALIFTLIGAAILLGAYAIALLLRDTITSIT